MKFNIVKDFNDNNDNNDMFVISLNDNPKLFIKNNILYNCNSFELAEVYYKKDIENSSSKQHEIKFKNIFESDNSPTLMFSDQGETYEEFIEKFISHCHEDFLNNLINYNGDLIKVKYEYQTFY